MAVAVDPGSWTAPDHMILLQYLLGLIFLVLFPFFGFLLNGTWLALIFRTVGERNRKPGYLRLGARLLQTATLGKSAGLMAALLGGLALFCVRMLYAPGSLFTTVWIVGLALMLAGMIPIYGFRSRVSGSRARGRDAALALAGSVGVAAGYFLLVCAVTLLLRPERWPLLGAQPVLLLSWSALARWLAFLTLGGALGGAVMLSPAGGQTRQPVAESSAPPGWKAGVIVLLAAVLILPVWVLFDLVNLPDFALSGVFFLPVAILFLLVGGLAWTLFDYWNPAVTKTVERLLAGVLVMYLLLLAADHLARRQALTPQTLIRPASAAPALKQTADTGAKTAPETGEVSGEAVFQRVCRSCHAFDERLVGPPLNEVVPDYRAEVDRLKAFIRNPVKKNPDYPKMPAPDLNERELDAVADYLLEKVGN